MFVPLNFLAGLSLAMVIGIIFYYTNAYNTSYLPINSPKTFDNKGKAFTVTHIVDKWGVLIQDKYQQYSQPWMSATRVVQFIGMFMYTSGTVAHTLLYNRRELHIGFGSAWKDLKRSCRNLKNKILRRHPDPQAEEDETVAFGDDIHYKLMQQYPEVPESWYLMILLVSMILSFVCLGVYTNVNPVSTVDTTGPQLTIGCRLVLDPDDPNLHNPDRHCHRRVRPGALVEHHQHAHWFGHRRRRHPHSAVLQNVRDRVRNRWTDCPGLARSPLTTVSTTRTT